MNLIISMFGGMLLTVVLYFVGRRLRLSNFWAAALATGVPTALYLVFAARAWPGMDVVTINVIAYPTVAVILFQFYGGKAELRLHWVPKLLVGFFVTLTVLFSGFVYVSTNGLPPALARLVMPGASGHVVHTGFSGVVEHGEEAARGISQHLKMDATLEGFGWQVEIEGLDSLSADREHLLAMILRGKDGGPVRDARVGIALARPGQPAPVATGMVEVVPGRYQTALRLAGVGAWVAYTSIDLGDKHIRLEHRLGGE